MPLAALQDACNAASGVPLLFLITNAYLRAERIDEAFEFVINFAVESEAACLRLRDRADHELAVFRDLRISSRPARIAEILRVRGRDPKPGGLGRGIGVNAQSKLAILGIAVLPGLFRHRRAVHLALDKRADAVEHAARNLSRSGLPFSGISCRSWPALGVMQIYFSPGRSFQYRFKASTVQ